MVIGALQSRAGLQHQRGVPGRPTLTLDNLRDIDQAIDLPRTLLNSGIFTGGVLLSPAGARPAGPATPGRAGVPRQGAVFSAMLLILIVPFQLLMIPLYVMIVRNYGLADSYLGMILPFAVNATAVFIFRQFFLQLPEAVRVGPPGRRQRAEDPHPHRHPAGQAGHPDRVILTFIGPWSEFLWPFLVTSSSPCSRWPSPWPTSSPPWPPPGQPVQGQAWLARWCWRCPRWCCSWCSSGASRPANLGSGDQGMTTDGRPIRGGLDGSASAWSWPPTRTTPARPGGPQPGERPRPDGGAVPVPAPGRRGQLLAGRPGASAVRRRQDAGRRRTPRGRAGARGDLGDQHHDRRRGRPTHHLHPEPGPVRHDLRRLRATQARIGLAVSASLASWNGSAPPGSSYEPSLRADLNLYTNKDALLFPDGGRRTPSRLCPAAPAHLGPVVGQPDRR